MADLDAVHQAKVEMWHELQMWMSWASDDAQSRQATRANILARLDYQEHKGISLKGFDRVSGAFVLATSLDEVEGRPDCYSTGYWVAKKWQRRGLATEAMKAVLHYAFKHMKAEAIFVNYYEGNEPSRRIIENLGFTPLQVRRKSFRRWVDGTLLDSHEFVMERKEGLRLHGSPPPAE
jgi:RimJ/RimL family protein N-acetyltransferase